MNRIVLIGNGFDLAHNLPTSYRDFINNYWIQRVFDLQRTSSHVNSDGLTTIKGNSTILWNNIINNWIHNGNTIENIAKYLIEGQKNIVPTRKIEMVPFFRCIIKAIETKDWVNIESEYYSWLKRIFKEGNCGYKEAKQLNNELGAIKKRLIEYLDGIQQKQINPGLIKGCIDKAIYEPFAARDMSVESIEVFREFIIQRFESVRNNIDNGNSLLRKYNKEPLDYRSDIEMEIKKFPLDHINDVLAGADGIPDYFLLPDQILLLNFNYTTTADMYLYKNSGFEVNHIHGTLGDDLNHIIFGYGDEMDDDYKTISKLNDNDYLTNIKSIRYLETDKYRQLLRFINSDYYQIYIMGHSCGNSDRTLLNTLFEHPKCVSIKPFYRLWQDEHGEWRDNYIEIIQNISRNFNSMQTMRDRVVNKEFCRPLVPKNN